MKKAIWAAVGLATMTGMALAASPEGAGKPEGPRTERRGPDVDRKARFRKALGLTDAQVADLRKLRAEGQKKRIQAHADAKVARLELRELLLAKTVDESAVRAKGKQVADLQSAMASERLESRLAMRRILTAEQAEKMMQLREGRSHRRHEGPRGDRGRGPGHRRGPRGADAGDDHDEDAAAL